MTRSTIGGPLDASAYAALSGDTERMRNFRELSPSDQAAAIRDLARLGYHPSTIASATSLSIEQIQAVLADGHRDVQCQAEGR